MTTAITKPQSLPIRTISTYEAGRANTRMTLGDVRDVIADADRKGDARDIDRRINTTHLRWGEHGKDIARLQLMTKERTLSGGMPLTRTALAQLTRDVLPSRGRNFLEELVSLGGPHPVKAADYATALFFQRNGLNPRRLRTVKQNGERVVRAVVSQSYNGYAHLQLLDDVLDGLDADADRYQVLSLRLTDDVLRVRFLLDDTDIGVRGDHNVIRFDESAPQPAAEIWNSETGQRAVYLKALAYRALCANGYAALDSETTWRWNHVGQRDRLRDGIRSALDDTLIHARGIVRDYNEALHTEIDDAWAWIMRDLEVDLNGIEVDAVREALDDETTTKTDGGQPRLLASCLDAVTLAAHRLHDPQDAEADLVRVEAMERTAAKIAARGLRERDDARRLYAPQPA